MESIRKYLVNASVLYYKFLDNNNLGIENIDIIDIRADGNNLHILIDKSAMTTESIQLIINGVNIDIADVAVFNKRTKLISAALSEEYARRIENELGAPLSEVVKSKDSEIYLYSDLKFLVQSVAHFCAHELEILRFPTKKPLPLKIKIPDYVNEEQKAAIKGVFNNQMSYIWGISGSGKTSVTLCLCAMNIIMQNKRLLILAPTNMALEHVIGKLIEQCDAKGISRDIFLRLGMASYEFMHEFPEACSVADDDDDKKKRGFFHKDMKTKLRESLVIGATLDTFIRKYKMLNNLKFAHIFLDECAFSPLIKLVAPMCLDTPITLLGDHKQLMPICLMEKEQIETSAPEVCVWNLNALFIERLLQDSSTLHLCSNYDDISFDSIANFKLRTTHRYGDNLAKILDSYVYFNGLRGLGEDTKIYYVDSEAYYKYQSGNENHGEAIAIKRIAAGMNKEDYAVLTPFRAQQALLVKSGIKRGRVFTIHKSQGREFDLVILSPVKFSPYMTNSNNMTALFTLNVAISRLRKELIIVCDYNFWINKDRQLISSLLKIAKPYESKGRLLL